MIRSALILTLLIAVAVGCTSRPSADTPSTEGADATPSADGRAASHGATAYHRASTEAAAVDSRAADDNSAAVEEIMVLEMPEIPGVLSTMEGRAAYLAAHFWDNLDFTDTDKSLNVNFMEENFIDFLSILPAVMSQDRMQAFDNLLDRAAVSDDTYWLVVEMGDKYLTHPDSPMQNQEYYIDFVASLLDDSIMTPAERAPYARYFHAVHRPR